MTKCSLVSFEPSLKRRKTIQEELHPTGCARTEGYYKIDPRDKTKYLPHLRRGKGEIAKEVIDILLLVTPTSLFIVLLLATNKLVF